MKKRVYYVRLTSVIFLIILIVLLKISLSRINHWKYYNKENEKIQEKIEETAVIRQTEENNNETETNEYKVDFQELKNINSDTVGWIEVPGTEINYSVVHTSNNSYYLAHNFNKEYNISGWIFADYSNKFDGNDKNIVIYGHNVRDGSMFGSLKKVLNAEWYNNAENYNVKLLTEKSEQIYKVFSVYQIEAEDYYIQTTFNNTKEFENFAQTLKKRSIKKFEEDVGQDDQILTLSTCANNNKYRVVLHAKKVEENYF